MFKYMTKQHKCIYDTRAVDSSGYPVTCVYDILSKDKHLLLTVYLSK